MNRRQAKKIARRPGRYGHRGKLRRANGVLRRLHWLSMLHGWPWTPGLRWGRWDPREPLF